MTIEFPNQSRSYDVGRRAVRFWGHDNVIEAAFTISAEALNRIEPGLGDSEDLLLRSFDANRPRIEKSARKMYVRGRKGGRDLTPDHF